MSNIPRSFFRERLAWIRKLRQAGASTYTMASRLKAMWNDRAAP